MSVVYDRRTARMAAALGLALATGLAGCSATPDWAKPTKWYDSVAGSKSKPEASGEASADPAAPPTDKPAADPAPSGQPAEAPAPQGAYVFDGMIPRSQAEGGPVAAPATPDAAATPTAESAVAAPSTMPAPVEPAPGFPNLASVPARPVVPVTSAERAGVVESLAADRNNARYTDEELRGGTEVPAAPPRTVEQPAQTPATTSQSSTEATPSAPAAAAAAVAAVPAPAAQAVESAPVPEPVAPPPPAAAPAAPAVSAAPVAAAAATATAVAAVPRAVEPAPIPAPVPVPAAPAAVPPAPEPAVSTNTASSTFAALFAQSGASSVGGVPQPVSGAAAARVTFEPGATDLDEASRTEITNLGRGNPTGRYRVVGHADDGGGAAAQAVARALIAGGVAPAAIRIESTVDAGAPRADVFVDN